MTILNLLDVFAFPSASFSSVLKVKPGIYGAGASLGNLKALKELEFRNVEFGFAYPIPPQLGSLPALESLHLIGTQCIGPIPAELGKLKLLKHLILDGNRFPHGIPVSHSTAAHSNLKPAIQFSVVGVNLVMVTVVFVYRMPSVICQH